MWVVIVNCWNAQGDGQKPYVQAYGPFTTDTKANAWIEQQGFRTTDNYICDEVIPLVPIEEPAQAAMQALEQAWHAEGHGAAAAGKPRSDNPYISECMALAWDAGWEAYTEQAAALETEE